MTLYATGVRRAELCRLKVADIDSERMVLHIHQGKGGRDRDTRISFATVASRPVVGLAGVLGVVAMSVSFNLERQTSNSP
jgi:hypothetical protein